MNTPAGPMMCRN